MKDTIALLYIDDRPETSLARYLDQEYSHEKHTTQYSDLLFKPQDGYESLLNNAKVKSADVIFVDSRLFENRTAVQGKFTGEEFKFVLKKISPYKEVIVITQNGVDGEIDMIAKYDTNSDKTSTEYYNERLKSKIDASIANIDQYWLLYEKMNGNNNWDAVLKDKVIATLTGSDVYDELTKTDINTLVLAFKEIQEKLND